MKLEVGMYLRINGFISKIGHINTSKKGNTYIQFKQPNGLLITMNTKFLDDEKASHNIIDLIEEGDYVNGYKVKKDEMGELYYHKTIGYELIEYCEIETIVTKEQFEQMQYKVGE